VTPCIDATSSTALVVDAGSDINELVDNVLKNEGWSVERVPDNHAVLSLVTAKPFDLIITRAKTQGPEGIELLHTIRRARPHVRLIVLTDSFTRGDVVAAIREHAFSYFSGPYEHAALAEMVRWAMDSPCWDDGLEIISATPSWVQVNARCDIATANRLVQFLRAVKDPDIPEADRENIASAFKEILLNAMEHGGHFDPSQYVEISYVRARHVVACRVKDPGEGFSLEELRHAAVNSPVDDLLRHVEVREAQSLRPGGFGLLLAKKLVDELIYNEKGNDVLLIKYIHQAASQVA
jgi:anti-sigma regulatory factor (Ser/Thr protein kinase)/ActR/RegA family two-component response regulator